MDHILRVKNMNKIILIISIFSVSITTIKAATLLENSRACINEEFFDQQVKAKTTKDMAAIEYLFKNGYCIMMNKDYQASILKTTWSGKIKVRVYADKNTTELWTYQESIKD